MAFTIAWTKKGLASSAKVLNYLEEHWSEKVAEEFMHLLEKHLLLLE